jgi:hypothetical protein
MPASGKHPAQSAAQARLTPDEDPHFRHD